LNTTNRVVEDQGYSFVIAHGCKDIKPPARFNHNFGKNITSTNNPFAGPFQEELVIEMDLNEKHRLVLNKYPLLQTQLIIVSKVFEPQHTPLDMYDIEALLLTMRVQDKPVLYFNCGVGSGASQPHKHIQTASEEAFHWTNGTMALTMIVNSLKNKTDAKELKPTNAFKLPEFNFKHEIRFFE